MTGRGVDQILPYPSHPRLYEPYIRNAIDYVTLAERAYGPIPRAVDFAYVWGAALKELAQVAPDARIINLETSLTTSADWSPKGINYRMHPKNIPCITAARIDCCVLGNNHVLDWGRAGLIETLETLRQAHVGTAGAGRDLEEAQAPARIPVAEKGDIAVFSWGAATSGIAREWAALRHRPGVNWLADFSESSIRRVVAAVRKFKRPGELIVVSLHWGPNWGYAIPSEQIHLAHRLIEEAGVHIVHGHSSHHAKGIEVYQGRLILYGCGDFLNDYEGIRGYENFRGDLVLMYFAVMDPVRGTLHRLSMIPLQIKRFQLHPVCNGDARWLEDRLTREGRRFGTRVELQPETNRLVLRWE